MRPLDLAPLTLLAPIALFVGCASSSKSSEVPDTGPQFEAPYELVVHDHAAIVSDSSKPNFQAVKADVALHGGSFAEVKLVLALESPCFPFEKWQTDKPPSGQNWPAACDAFDRNYETWLSNPADPTGTPLELVRAITPFGGPEDTTVDVTDVFNDPALAAGAKRSLEVHIATWSDGAGKVSGSAGQWFVTAKLQVTPGVAPRKVVGVVPIVNTNVDEKWMPSDLPLTLPAGTTHTHLEYRVTGHGGGAGGAGCIGPNEEFCKRSHHVFADAAKLGDLTPWRTDCKANCTLAHSTVLNNDYCTQNPCGDQNSVKAPRANWCPGTMTPPVAWDDPWTTPGAHTFKYAIDGIVTGGSWRVSAHAIAYGD